ncbi:MAG TPA: hypothetical protein VE422_07195 [Terriglobia bacterium]|nr:hypothetical protein [Terriglobia bacterium]
MQNRIILMITFSAAVLALVPVTLAQAAGQNQNATTERTTRPSIPPPPGWGNCPRCQNNQDRTNAWSDYKVDTHPFNPKDLSGVWGYDGVANAFDARSMPALTEWGKKQHEATFGEKAPDGTPLRSKDTSGRGAASVNCDPLGWPRLHTYNYGFEFVMLPDRVLQFFELNHTWRTIWTDGRKLPEDPPEPHWLGWNVGHWEGDTFVVESNGYDERSWINQSNPDGGWTHSDEMKIVERYKRINYGSLEAQLTIIDPKTYAQPWVTPKATIKLVPGAELWENFCVPSDYQQFNQTVFRPAAGADKK